MEGSLTMSLAWDLARIRTGYMVVQRMALSKYLILELKGSKDSIRMKVL